MLDALPPLEGGQIAGSPRLPFMVASHAASELPSLPPAEVLDALDTAARVLDELDRKQIRLRVEHDLQVNRVRTHLRDEVTGIEHEISAARLFTILGGDLRGLAVDVTV